MSHIENFERDEAATLADLDGGLAAVARTGPERVACIDAAQAADLAASDEGRQRLEAARLAAITADSTLRTGDRGRPKISPERYAYRQLCESMQEAPDIYKIAWDRYAKTIQSLRDARPELDALQVQADEQSGLCQAAVKHLEDAAAAYGQAVALADAGRATMARLSDLVAFNSTPFVELAAGPRELHDLCKRWALRLGAELSRLGKDAEADLAEQRERRADAEYRKALDVAAKDFRKVADGRAAWQNYKQAMRELEATQAADPQADCGGLRECAQRLLTQFYGAAATHGQMVLDPAAIPQVN